MTQSLMVLRRSSILVNLSVHVEPESIREGERGRKVRGGEREKRKRSRKDT